VCGGCVIGSGWLWEVRMCGGLGVVSSCCARRHTARRGPRPGQRRAAPMSGPKSLYPHQPGGLRASFECAGAASVRRPRARCAARAGRMWAAWMLSVTAVLSWRVSDRALRISSAAAPIGRLGARPTATFGTRELSAGKRCATNAGSCADRACAAAACVRGRADPVALLQPCRRPRTLILALLASLSRDRLSCVVYVQ